MAELMATQPDEIGPMEEDESPHAELKTMSEWDRIMPKSGGRKTRKTRKTRKSRKTRKTRKTRKSRKTRK